MKLKDIQDKLSEEYVIEVVDNIEMVLEKVNQFTNEDTNIALIKDIVLSTEDEDARQLIYQSIFALMNIRVLDIDLINTDRDEIIPYEQIGDAIFNPTEYIEYSINQTNYKVHKSNTELCVTKNV